MNHTSKIAGSPLAVCALLAASAAPLPALAQAVIEAAPAGNTPAATAPAAGAPVISAPVAVTGVAPAAADAPAATTSGITAGINILILALDDTDIRSARPGNLRDIEPPRPPAARTAPVAPAATAPAPAKAAPPAVPNVVTPLPPAGEAEEEVLELPAAPARPRVPADELNGGEMPAITPAAAAGWKPQVSWSALAQAGPIPDLPGMLAAGEGAEVELVNRRPPGRAQSAAAPLRRVLVGMGARDVLTTPLDGPTIVRAVNNGRLSLKAVDLLRYSTEQLLANPGASADELTPELAQAREIAIQNAARVGLSLGYRAVVVLALTPAGEYSYLLVDATEGVGQAFAVQKTDVPFGERDQSAASEAAAVIAGRLNQWPAFTPADRAAKIEEHLAAAREAMEQNDRQAAQDHLLQAVALDASHSDAYIMMGDILQNTDPAAAAAAYQRAAEINTRNGSVWARIAIVHTLASPPDWVRSLQAATRAQTLGYDSANLRTAMAAAEFGRADLFRRNGRPDQAEDAEAVASRHLARAREMAPDDPEVEAGISRLMAKYLLEQKRYREAVQALDLLAVQYPNDLQTQLMYAQALEGYGRREEDLFAAWARVWKLGGESDVVVDATRYARITDGFDQRIFALARNIFQMTSGVATGALPRESALLQAERSRDEIKSNVAALQLMRPPGSRSVSDAHNARLFAADLMQQAAEFYILYLETGSDLNRTRGVEIHRQAIESLNSARLGGQGTAAF